MPTTKVVVGRAALTAVLLAATVALMMALSGPGSRLQQAHAQTARLMLSMSRLPAVRPHFCCGTVVAARRCRRL